MRESAFPDALPQNTRLHWFVLDRVLGQGGFGITYLARDNNLDQLVAVKEYLPVEVATRRADSAVQSRTEGQRDRYRWGLERFIREARTLARFDHPNIVRVHSVFELNNTAYMVMRFEEGENLAAVLEQRGTLSESELFEILLPVLDGLELVHGAGFIHRDIKPENIQIRTDGSPVLLDFGSARHAVGASRTLTILVAPGYAPFEQYYSSAESQGPWTDLYSLGATCYRAIAGRPPPDAISRSKGILGSTRDAMVSAAVIGSGRYSGALLGAIDHALAFAEKDRPQSIAEWRTELVGSNPELPARTPKVQARASTVQPPATAAPATASPAPVASRSAAPVAAPVQPETGPRINLSIRWATAAALMVGAGVGGAIAALLWLSGASAPKPAMGDGNAAPVAQRVEPLPASNPPPAPEPKPEAVVSTKPAPESTPSKRMDPPARSAPAESPSRKATSAPAPPKAKPVAPAVETRPTAPAVDTAPPSVTNPPTPVAMAPPAPTPAEQLAKAKRAIELGRYAEAVELLKPLAEANNAGAMYELANLYLSGNAVEPNTRDGLRLYERAVELGHVGAMTKLGDIYAAGRWVTQSDTIALDWYRKAADKGDTEAQVKLGDLYANGRGVKKDLFYAYVWYSVAALGGDSRAKAAMQSAAAQLQPAEQEQARRLAEGTASRLNAGRASLTAKPEKTNP